MRHHEFTEFDGPQSYTDAAGNRVLCKGGGGGGTSTTTQEIPAELKPLATAYTDKAIGLSNTPFQSYSGDRYADMNNYQNLGMGMAANRALTGSKTMNNAEGNLNQMMSGGSNPYLDQMVNRAQGNILSNAGTQSLKSGSFGNTGIAEAAARQMGDVAANMYGSAYESDQGRRMQAINMAPTFGNSAYQDASQLMGVGQKLQDQQQQNLDFGYSEFMRGINKPYSDLAAMSGVFGSNLGGTSTTQQSGGGGK